MCNPSFYFNPSAPADIAEVLGSASGQAAIRRLTTATTALRHIMIKNFVHTFRLNAWLPVVLAFIVTASMLCLMPSCAAAAEVLLAWDANVPAPDGYCVFQRREGEAFDYANPAWPADGTDHKETTCTITDLTAGATYFFVVRAYVGEDQSGDSNEVSYQAELALPETVTYSISASSGPNGAITPSGNITVTSGADQNFIFAPDNGYQVADVLVDGQSVGALSSYTFSDVTQNRTISVSFAAVEVENLAPIAEAGASMTVTAGDTVTLNGAGSSDPDGDTLTYLWTQNSGQSVALSGADAARCSFTAPAVTTDSATLVFELTVTDSNGLFSRDTCLVLVNPAPQTSDNDGDGVPDDLDSDDDNDGLPDTWETQNNLDPYTNDAEADPDSDGITNLEEYQAGSDPNRYDGNTPPDQPTLISPTDGAVAVELTPRLKAGAFSDPDSGDTHSKTQWRIIYKTGTRQTVLDLTKEKRHLTGMRVPRLVLDPSTAYIAQIRFFDNHGEPSEWSSPVSFTTDGDSRDVNRNMIPDVQEITVDTDLNGDTIPDVEQETVIKSVATYDGAYAMAVGIQDGETAASVEAAASVDPASLENVQDTTGVTQFGLLGYKIVIDQPGQSTNAIIYLSDPIDPKQTQWACYNEGVGLQDCTNSTTIDESGIVVTRRLVDGGDEDADGTANGVIVDLSGPRSTSVSDSSSLAISTDGQAADSGGSGGGCFIQSLF